MDDQKSSEVDKMDHGVMLPGFRFHPTDEELVGFYLKKKIQNQVLPHDIIKQVDIYKNDPWDLPNLALLGEKEWYFYCPRDRKYKNSARPNRVTEAGFWKATGTDRPIYSTVGTKCIGLKKSLVFYRGRAAKAFKTDWMMHEFRLPSVVELEHNKKIQDKKILPNDAWVICRIFKKTNSATQRSISHSWVSSFVEDKTSEFITKSSELSPDNISCMTDHLCYTTNSISPNSCSDLDQTPSYRPLNQFARKPSHFPLPYVNFGTDAFRFSSTDTIPESRVLNLEDTRNECESIDFGGEQPPIDNFMMNHYPENDPGNVRSGGFPVSFPAMLASTDEWRINMTWDSPPCHSASTNYSTSQFQI